MELKWIRVRWIEEKKEKREVAILGGKELGRWKRMRKGSRK